MVRRPILPRFALQLNAANGGHRLEHDCLNGETQENTMKSTGMSEMSNTRERMGARCGKPSPMEPISILRDTATLYNEVFPGFSFTKYDGTPVTIGPSC
jgi:hypothetical protein